MYYRPRNEEGGLFGFPPAITNLVLVTSVIYLAQMLLPHRFILPSGLALVPHEVVTQGRLWELVTYIFLHGGGMHLIFNMFYLVMFGADLERWWGRREFLKFYLITGVGAGVIHVLTAYLFGGPMETRIPTIGASGSIFGVLVAYAMAFPDRRILIYFVIPVSARVMVGIAALFQIGMLMSGTGGGIAVWAHLGGMLVGYLYLKQEKWMWRVKRLWAGLQGSSRPKPRKPEDDAENAEYQAKIDAILEKISREGMDSLSAEERRLLHERAERGRRMQRGQNQ